MTPDAFFAIPNGTREFNHGADQCVALANLFHEDVLGSGFVPVNSAFQWWTNFNRYPQLTSTYTQIPAGNDPIHGDVFVSRGGQYDSVHGHIGVVTTGWNGSTFGTMEQNAGSGAKRYVWRYDRTKANMLGFLRPINQNLINPSQPVTTQRKQKDMMFVIIKETGVGVILGEFTMFEINPKTDPVEFASAEAIWGAGMNRVYITAEQLRLEMLRLDMRRKNAPK
jgi:hypothetical protein